MVDQREGALGRRPAAEREESRPRVPRPPLPEGVDSRRLDRQTWRQLRTLSEENAALVAEHLVAIADLVHTDPETALAHGLFVAARAGRVAAAREALGLVRYARGEWAEALKEFRAVRRMSGSEHLLPLMADCERGLGRPERALDLVRSPEAASLSQEDRVELAIVGAGARVDLGQQRAAVLDLRPLATRTRAADPWAARLFYAYAAALLAVDDTDDAGAWFERSARADTDRLTEAVERLEELGLREALPMVVDVEDDADQPEPEDDAGHCEEGGGQTDQAGDEVDQVDQDDQDDSAVDRGSQAVDRADRAADQSQDTAGPGST